MNWRKGFSLIELLVVIGIIALLASLILASLSTARDKARDAAIKSELVQLRSQAELYFAKNGIYGGSNTGNNCDVASNMFALDENINALLDKINSDSGSTAFCRHTTASKTWSVSAKLRTDPNLSWCVDSAGASKQIPSPLTNAPFPCN